MNADEIERAIESLEYLIGGDCCDNQMDFVEEIELALAALRSEAERGKGCVSCDGGFGDNTVEFKKLGYTTCPCCGKRLEVEP
jgi:hypothetical protein